MPYQLPDGRTIASGVPFTLNDINYPANWLQLSTPADRKALGILELAEPPAPPDQRFYWGWDSDGNAIPKDHAQLVELWSQQTRTTAGTLLTPTDWMVVREMDNGTPMSDAYRDWRQAVRGASEAKVAAIAATTTTDELAAYITGADYHVWPRDPSSPPAPEPPVPNGMEPPSNVEAAGS